MNILIVGIVVSIASAGICFIATQNIFSTALICLAFLVFFIAVARRQIDKTQQKIHRYHECFQFINTYIISLNVKGSLNAALQSAYEVSDSDTKEIIDSIKELTEEEKLAYLNKYFKFDLYHLFVDTVFLWHEQGGDILKMSRYLVEQVRLKEEYLITCQTISKTKTTEFVVLWAIALAILAALRFALSQFFSYISKTIFYQVAVVATLLFLLFSIYLLLLRVNKLNLEGWKDDEK